MWQTALGCQCRNTIQTKVMGMSLSMLEKRTPGIVPDIMSSALKYLDNEQFLIEEGLFRKSGSSTDIDNYMRRIDSGIFFFIFFIFSS